MNFGKLYIFQHIFVVGPQRSGTRYIAKCISKDTTRHPYVDESEFHVDSLHEFQRLVWDHPLKMVVQCPGITPWVHAFARDEDAVVFAWRDIPDIKRSQKLAWPTRSYDFIEALKYGKPGDSAKVKQHYWEFNQKARIKNNFTVRFPEDVEDRDDFVPKEKRVGWKNNQTEAE